MEIYTPKTFTIPELKGISKKTVEEHLKLYAGYVKNANLILAKIDEYKTDPEKNTFVLGELQRRFSFEFDGMRNHEYYFHSLENGASPLADGALKKAIAAQFGSFDAWLAQFKMIGLTRGVGWAVLYSDSHSGRLTHAWIDEQHLGHLTGLSPILCLDMWEHSYLFDYVPADKKKYIEAFFENLNWNVVEKNFVS